MERIETRLSRSGPSFDSHADSPSFSPSPPPRSIPGSEPANTSNRSTKPLRQAATSRTVAAARVTHLRNRVEGRSAATDNHGDENHGDNVCPSHPGRPSQPVYLCPIQYALDRLDSKWTIAILKYLSIRPHRPAELMNALAGISSKTLTQRLRDLEHHGLVSRRIFAEVPPHVEYALTEKGQDVEPLMRALAVVGARWLGRSEPCDCPSYSSFGDSLSDSLTPSLSPSLSETPE